MTLNDAASIAAIVSAVVVLAAFVVASLAAKWARDSAVASKEAVKEGHESAELSKQAAELQRQNVEGARATVQAIDRVQRHQQRLVEVEWYEYLLGCVTRIEATARNQNNDTFRDERNQFYDALDLLPRDRLTRSYELAAAHVDTALGYSTNAKTELNAIIRDLRQHLIEDVRQNGISGPLGKA
jgi:5-bromo-4-chloroindolyl phosphate hydrolysis protein